jgi:hypothetical protein
VRGGHDILNAGVEGKVMTTAPATDYGADRRMARGLLCSALLHFLIMLLLVRASWPHSASRPQMLAVPIDLVSIAEDGVAPAGPQKAAIPQAKARESAERPDPRAVPPKGESGPVDPLTLQLRRLAQMKLPPSPAIQDGAGLSNVTAGSGRGGEASYGIKDFLRAQIERRWVLPAGALERNDWVVRLHLKVKEDGSVLLSEIVDDPRMAEDQGFRDFAFSARNAALLASPLTLPPQFAGQLRDVVLDFNPRRVQQ